MCAPALDGTPTRTSPPSPTRATAAADGKTPRGSGHPNPQVHLLAAMDHATGGILGQTDVDHTTNEIARFRPLASRRRRSGAALLDTEVMVLRPKLKTRNP